MCKEQDFCTEDTAVAYLAALAGGKDFDVAPASVKGISQGYDVAEFEDRAVAAPYGEVDGVCQVHGISLLNSLIPIS